MFFFFFSGSLGGNQWECNRHTNSDTQVTDQSVEAYATIQSGTMSHFAGNLSLPKD